MDIYNTLGNLFVYRNKQDSYYLIAVVVSTCNSTPFGFKIILDSDMPFKKERGSALGLVIGVDELYQFIGTGDVIENLTKI